MGIIISLLLTGVAVFLTDKILSGVTVDSFITAIIVAVVLGIANAVLKPILTILTLPINLMTLGLFTFVINALIVILVSMIIPGFHVDNFIWALLFSVVLSVVNSVLGMLGK